MASPSLTYTLTNGTTADASQVMQNFNDLLNGYTDGTKDLSISALTCAGTATFNGSVAVGNASGDDLTVTASLASDLPIKTTATYNIGSSTLGLLSAYFGRNSQSVRVIGSSSMSATWTLTLPVDAGTANYLLMTNGSGTTSWTQVANANVSASAAIAYSKLTLTDSIVNADINSSAAIADTKLAQITTANKVSGSAITTGNISTSGSITTSSNILANHTAAASGEPLKVTSTALSANKQFVISCTDNGSDRSAIGARYINGGAPTQSDGFLRLNRGQNSTNYYVYFDSSSDLRYSSDNDNVGQLAGTVIGTQTSDRRLKKDVEPLKYGLADVLKLKPVSFKFTYDKVGKTELGLIAQDVLEVVPEAVYDTKDKRDDVENVLALATTHLVPVLVRAVQELSAKVDALSA